MDRENPISTRKSHFKAWPSVAAPTKRLKETQSIFWRSLFATILSGHREQRSKLTQSVLPTSSRVVSGMVEQVKYRGSQTASRGTSGDR